MPCLRALSAALALLLPAAALADCQADFARDNRIKPEAGPFQILETSVPMSLLSDGQWVHTLQRVRNLSVTQVVPAQKAISIMAEAGDPLGSSLILIKQKGWKRLGATGPWQPLDTEFAKELANLFGTYLNVEGHSQLSCTTGEQDGRSVRVYRYSLPGNGITGKTIAVTAIFDAAHGLPLTVAAEGYGPQQRFTATGSYTFGSDIRIQPPTSAAKP